FQQGRYLNIVDPAVRERIRSQWALEEAGQAERRYLAAQERARWEVEKKEAMDEKLRRMRARLYWAPVKADWGCAGSNLRGYSARLENVPSGVDVMLACKGLPLVFQGVVYPSPDYCKSERVSALIFCFESTQADFSQRIKARLSSVGAWDDGLAMCYSTPNNIGGHQYKRPLTCVYEVGLSRSPWRIEFNLNGFLEPVLLGYLGRARR
ncbi:hypothetical protein H0H81_011244, partial [Sphagnurus paluster]